MPIDMRIAFKPTATVLRPQQSADKKAIMWNCRLGPSRPLHRGRCPSLKPWQTSACLTRYCYSVAKWATHGPG